MSKPQKANDDSSAFDRLKRLTKALFAVPHKELKEKLGKYNREKDKGKKQEEEGVSHRKI